MEKARSLPLDDLSPEPHLKISGIAIVLAEVLEANNQPEEAYKVYMNALSEIRQHNIELSPEHFVQKITPNSEAVNTIQRDPDNTPAIRNSLTRAERVRTVALAYYLGGMAEKYGQSTDEQEKWLTYAVTEMMRILAEDRINKKNVKNIEERLDLPVGLTLTDVAAPMEALGAFCVKNGRPL